MAHSALMARVTSVAARLCAANGIRQPITVYVLKSGPVVSYATYGGRIVLSEALLDALAEHADERTFDPLLAAVLAHEMAHVLARHPAESSLLGIIQWSLLASVGLWNFWTMPTRPHELALIARSPRQEIEADKLALCLLAKACFDPAAAGKAGQIVQEEEDYQKLHPTSQGRARSFTDARTTGAQDYKRQCEEATDFVNKYGPKWFSN